MATAEPAIYDELLDVLAGNANLERLLAFRLPDEKQLRLDRLVEKSREGTLTAEEQGQLDEFMRLEHLGRMLKARVRQRLKS